MTGISKIHFKKLETATQKDKERNINENLKESANIHGNLITYMEIWKFCIKPALQTVVS